MQITRQTALNRAFATRAMSGVQNELARLQEQLATARRINRASDDPAALAVSKKLTEGLQRNEQWQRNIENARTWMDQGQDALNTLVDLMGTIREKGVQGANASLSDHDRTLLANEVQGMLGEMVDALNHRFGDQYIFAGTRFSEPPFSLNEMEVTYSGNDGQVMRRIGEDSHVSVNVSGIDVVTVPGGGTIPDSIARLVEALSNGSPEDITGALAAIEAGHEHVLSQATMLGSRANRISAAADQLRDMSLVLTTERSRLEDTDFLSAMQRFQELQVNHQAALQTTAVVLQKSLLDYLR